MATAVIDWIRLSSRWTAILTPDRQRALSQMSAADQNAFLEQVSKAAPLSDADRRNLTDAKGAYAQAASTDLVEKVFAASNKQFDQFAKAKGIKLPETMMLA